MDLPIPPPRTEVQVRRLGHPVIRTTKITEYGEVQEVKIHEVIQRDEKNPANINQVFAKDLRRIENVHN